MNTKKNAEAAQTSGSKARAKEMNARLREKCRRIRKTLREMHGVEITARHEVGKIIHQIEKSPGTYGTGAVEKVAKDLGCDRSLLYDAATVAKTWTLAQIKKLIAKQDTSSGQGLTWSHLVALAGVQEQPRRQAHLKKAQEEGLSVRQLVAAINGPKPAAKADDAPQHMDLTHALRNLKAEADVIAERAEHWDKHVFASLVEDRSQLGSQELIDALKQARSARAKAKEICEAQVKEIDRCLRMARKQQSASSGTASSAAA